MADGMFAKELEDELMKYTKKCDSKVDANLVEKTNDEVRTNGEVEVNITECTKSLGNQMLISEDQDSTECSSSFGDSGIGAEDVDTLGDTEATSDFRGDAEPALDFDGFGESFRMRKKKVTSHWRSFIQPLMWRSKWVELQVKKLEAQAVKYERQLEAYNKEKKIQLDNSTTIDVAKSVPFSRKNANSEVFKRKKRRRTEAISDVAAYMSQHNLFSCYENRKCLTEEACMNNDQKNPGTRKIEDESWSNDELSLDPGDDDNFLENILRKIDIIKSHVGKLRSKTDQIMSENAERLSFADSLIISPPEDDNVTAETCTASQTRSELHPLTAATNQADIPITNEGTGQACSEACTSVEDGVLVDNQSVDEEMKVSEEERKDSGEMPMDLENGSGQTTPPVLDESDPLAEDESLQKIRSIAKLSAPKNKRKRGRKRAAAGRRGRKPSG